MSKTIHFNFSEYVTGITVPIMGTKYTLNGDKNKNFKVYKDSYDDSPTNAFIINTIVNYIFGNGLIDKNGIINPDNYLSRNDLRMLCLDFKIYGSSFAQVTNYNQIPIKIRHIPTMSVGLNIDNKTMDINGYWYSFDFSFPYRFTPKFYPKFDNQTNDNLIEILYLKRLSSEPFFPFPDWFSGIKSANIESALIDDAVNYVKRGFQGKTIININNGGMMSDDEKEETKKEIKENWTGTKNSDGVTIQINDSASESMVVDTIEPRGRNDQFIAYDEASEIKLMAAHSAMNIIFQRPGSSGFSNNADEIATATKSLYLGVINPIREIILDYLKPVFLKINPDCDIDFINFVEEKLISND